MKVSTLKYGKNNPRNISKDALAKLAESIQRDPQFMVLRPMVIDENNEVIGGNQRLKAIKQLGMKKIPDNWVVLASDLTDEQKKRFILVDNAPAGMAGEWDVDLLAEHWEVPELAELGFDVEALGLGVKQVNEDECDSFFDEGDGEPEGGENKKPDKTTICPKCGFKWLAI